MPASGKDDHGQDCCNRIRTQNPLLTRLMAAINGAPMASPRIALRNGDLPCFSL